MLPASFNGPRILLKWTSEELEKFKVEANAFIYPGETVEFTQYDPLTDLFIVGVVRPRYPPDSIQKSAYRLVTDLRNALDQAAYAASVALRPNLTTKNAYFPFGEDITDFKKALATQRSYSHIPVELHPTFEAFRPYWPTKDDPDGNAILRSLALIANPNKHVVPLEVASGVGAGIKLAKNIAYMGGRWHGDDKLEVYRAYPNVEHEIDIDLYYRLTFHETRALHGASAPETIENLFGMITGIVDTLEAETARLIGS